MCARLHLRAPRRGDMLPIIFLLFDFGIGMWESLPVGPDPTRPFEG